MSEKLKETQDKPTKKQASRFRFLLVGRGGVRETVGKFSLFLNYLQSLGGEHSFSALISITVNASLVSLSARLLLRTTAAVIISPMHIKIYPPSLWDNGYIWLLRTIMMPTQSWSFAKSISRKISFYLSRSFGINSKPRLFFCR